MHFYVALTATLVLVGCGEQSSQPGQATNTTRSEATPLNAPAQYVGALGRGQQLAVKTADKSSLQQAIQMFSAEHGRYPKDLNELVEQKYIPRLPEAPYGMKIVYDAATGKVSFVNK